MTKADLFTTAVNITSIVALVAQGFGADNPIIALPSCLHLCLGLFQRPDSIEQPLIRPIHASVDAQPRLADFHGLRFRDLKLQIEYATWESSHTSIIHYVDDPRVSKGRVPNAVTRKLGARVRALRKKRNWTQAELGDHLGIDRGHVSEIECGKRMITLETMQTLAKGFDTTMSSLLKGI